MKKHFFKLLFAATLLFGMSSCKDNSKAKEEVVVLDEVENKEEAQDFAIDTQLSSIHWEGYKPGDKHDGTISLSEGKISLKEDQVVGGDFVIDMKSIEVSDLEGEDKERLEVHLMGTAEGTEDHFFDVNKFPTAKFKVTGTTTEDGVSFLVGDLTIKEKTNQIRFPFEVSNLDADTVELKAAAFKIDRSDWDIKFKSKSFFDNLGGNFIHDEIQLEIKLVAKRA